MTQELGTSLGSTSLSADRPSYSQRSSAEVTPTAPNWFHRALARQPEVAEVEVAGARIRYLSWGPQQGPATVFVHGGAAHAQWWAPLAAQFDPEHRVVALDLSGHGLSDWRDRYRVGLWAEEVFAVAQAASSSGRATIIGHSLGGIVCAVAAVRYGEHFERMIFVDAPVWAQAPVPVGVLPATTDRSVPTYPSVDAAYSRFRLIPWQECANDWYVRHIAWHGLRPEPDGWQWRFDSRIFANPTGDHRIARFEGSLVDSRCPYAVIFGERSYLAKQARHEFGEASRKGGAPLIFVPGAAHHVMLDQPLRLLSALRDLLASWHG